MLYSVSAFEEKKSDKMSDSERTL